LTSNGPSHPAVIVDVSQRGLALRVDREYLPGASVQVFVGQEVFVGKVQHSAPSGSGEFIVGITFRTDILAAPPA
jgi:hypothetical protein